MKFSIVITISRGVENKDRWTTFTKCFGSLLYQSYPKDLYEVVIVDSGSGISQDRMQSLRTESLKYGVNFTIIEPQLGNIGPAKARNIGYRSVGQGATKLKSEVIAFTDDDVLVPLDWLSLLSEGLKKFPSASGAGGVYLPSEEEIKNNLFAVFDAYIYNRYFLDNDRKSFYISKLRDEHPVFSGNISYKREVLEQVGGFDETYEPFIYGEDGDLKERILSGGYFLVYVPCKAIHLSDYSFLRFIRQQESRGAGILKFRLKHQLKFPSRWEIVIRVFLTPLVFFVYSVKNYREPKIVILETLAYFFRQTGKLRYYAEVRCQKSDARSEDRNKKRLLFVDHTPLVGGSQLALLRHLRYLDKSRFQISVVTSYDQAGFDGELKEIDSINVQRMNFPQIKNYNLFSWLRFLSAGLNLIKIAKKGGSRILVANTERAFYVCFMASVILNRKLILIVRDFEYSKTLLKLIDFKVSKFICVSKKIQSFYGFNSLKSSVIYVGSDLDEKLKGVTAEQEQEFRLSLGGSRDDLVIGFVGRLIVWKGPELLLKSFAHLCGRYRNLKLVFVGDGTLKEQLQILTVSLGMKDKVLFTGFTSDVPVWYKVFDVFVHASIKDEPFATTVIEAALAGLPIVATDTGGTAEFIENNVNGLLVKPEEGCMAEALEKLIDNKSLRSKLGASAHQKAQNNYTETKITKELEKVYDII